MTTDRVLDTTERAAIAAEWLNQCGSCDAGLPMGCCCSSGDPRPIIACLLEALDAETVRADTAEEWRRALMTGEHCCWLGCDGGACETCPCCCAGWCVNGRDQDMLTDPDDYRAWLEVAAEHNPIAALLAAAERDRERLRAALVAEVSGWESGHPRCTRINCSDCARNDLARRIRAALAVTSPPSEEESRG